MPDVLSTDDLNTLAAEFVLGTLDYEERKGASALLEVDPAFRGMVRIWEKRFGELHLMVESVQPDTALWERIRPKLADLKQVSVAIPPEPPEPLVAAIPVEPAKPEDAGTPLDIEAATAEAEKRLAELAALQQPSAAAPEAPAEKPIEKPSEDPQPRAAEPAPRGFVTPSPVIKRSPPPVATSGPARRAGRGWMATSLAMALVAVMLAGLISAWRFFPERLPTSLGAYSVLNIPLPKPPPPSPPPRPPAFDE